MVKWKLQAVEPDTCDGAAQGQGCRYLEWWDADAPPQARTHTVAAFERICSAHDDAGAAVIRDDDLMLGFDGNWKPRAAYIEYQRAWFRRLNHVEWQATRGGEPMPPGISSFTSDPVTTGSLPAPAQAARDGLARVTALARTHNVRKNSSLNAMKVERANIDMTLVTWTWSGNGDARVLRINSGGQLTAQQRTRVQAACDIQFGLGTVIVEG